MFRLMVVTDRQRSTRPITETVRLALEGGADAVQLRERDMEAGEFHQLAEALRQVTREAGARLIVNHRLDVALSVEADGVHIGWRSLGVRDARKLGGDRFIIGVSCHNMVQIRSAEEAGADYVMLGPVFATPSKEGLVDPLGLDALRQAVAAVKVAIVAIGGITPENVSSVLDTGVAGIAAISAIIAAEDPRAAAQALRKGLTA